MVYRGIRIGVANDAYKRGSYVTWSSFSSATCNISVELTFLTTNDAGVLTGTLFHIELTSKQGDE